jgi:branched-chain amino acid aminotransferase
MLINLNGKIVPKSEAKVSIFDHGFLYGDSIYETLRTYGGKPFLLDLHLLRLQESARGIYLELPISPEQLKRELIKTLEAARYPESYGRIIVTRGEGDIGYDPKLCRSPSFIILVTQLMPPPPEIYEKGVTISLVSVRRNLASAINPAVKSGNLLNQTLAWMEAAKHEAYEALMLNYKGELAECTMSNIFLLKIRRLSTPALDCGILPGITRKLVLEIAQLNGLELRESSLSPQDLFEADEAFLTGTSREIIPVVRCDRQVIGSGAPGPITKFLHAKYKQKVEELMSSSLSPIAESRN